jgi:hypothetical protein
MIAWFCNGDHTLRERARSSRIPAIPGQAALVQID